jgi:hypothetical protein
MFSPLRFVLPAPFQDVVSVLGTKTADKYQKWRRGPTMTNSREQQPTYQPAFAVSTCGFPGRV